MMARQNPGLHPLTWVGKHPILSVLKACFQWTVRLILTAMAAAIGLTATSMAGEKQPLITRIQEIRQLSREAAAAAIPVHISGVCTYAASGELSVHDGKAGIWVSSNTSISRGLLKGNAEYHSFRPGMAIEIEGVTDPGGYAPQILPVAIRRSGDAPLPVAVRIPTMRLISGSADGQWVEVEGVVQDMQNLEDRTVCSVIVDGVNCWLALYGDARSNIPAVVDAKVRVSGVCAPDFNNRSEAITPKIVNSSPAPIEVLVPPPADPFEATRVPLNRLRAFSSDSSLFHRRVTSGMVTFVLPGGFFFIRNGGTSVRVSSSETDMKPGWLVDVAGFVDTSQHFASLKNGIVRKTGESTLPPASRVTPKSLLESASRQRLNHAGPPDLSGQRVTLPGRIRRVDRTDALSPVDVWLESGEYLFPAHFPPGTRLSQEQAEAWSLGAEAEITGACELEFRDKPDPLGLYQPIGFHLWLTTPDDLRIVRRPPWWTPQRSFAALAAAAGILALILAWTWTLRRRVQQQTATIGRQLQRVAVQDERARIARDMHDEIGGKLARLSLIGEMAADEAASQETNLPRIRELTRGVREAAGELEQIIWSIDPCHDTLDGVAHRVFQFAEEYFADTPIDCRFSEFPELPKHALPPENRADLIAAFRESIANVLKHSGARQVEISVGMDGPEFEIRVSDDGRGFDPSTADSSLGNGLKNMKARMERIGGKLFVESSAGDGTTLRFRWNPFIIRSSPS